MLRGSLPAGSLGLNPPSQSQPKSDLKCNESIHVKCFVQASKIFKTGNTINWKFAMCNEEASASHSTSVDVNLLLKEFDNLKRENELLA